MERKPTYKFAVQLTVLTSKKQTKKNKKKNQKKNNTHTTLHMPAPTVKKKSHHHSLIRIQGQICSTRLSSFTHKRGSLPVPAPPPTTNIIFSPPKVHLVKGCKKLGSEN